MSSAKQGKKVNKANSTRTELMTAASMGDGAAVGLLLRAGAVSGAQDEYGWTALMLASLAGATDCIDQLLELEAGKRMETWPQERCPAPRVFPIVGSGATSLMVAATCGYAECVTHLLKSEGKSQTAAGVTALMCASAAGQVACVNLLLEEAHLHTTRPLGKNGAYPNGTTALMLAAREGHVDVVQALIPHLLGMVDEGGKSASHYALEGGHFEVALLLRDEYKEGASSTTMLMAAAACGNIEVAQRYVSEQGMCDTRGRSALMLAVAAGHTNTVSLLAPLEHTLTDDKGKTATQHALELGRPKLALLLAKGASDGMTQLMLAARAGDVEALQASLVEARLHDSRGRTALMCAAFYGHAACVALLLDLERGYVDANGWTALMYAALAGHVDVAKLLLTEAEAESTDWGFDMPPGTTAAAIAKSYEHQNVLALLIQGCEVKG
ncbi:Ankyrin repeat protein 1 [Giardia muris]|uniref:Ankyrin repeat protein 1 n=1 Tax=Giardia muris TaxID=5742 RepID=A0A4Z1SZH4_GIAMU|nr:Ankyrin repeat protein 1 [Giardia muris]|eukprot:TNJ27053.1 Ankyrin repeat protein 1 [Giardia muris]